MKIVVIGDGKLGLALSRQLSREGHDIVIIDHRPEALRIAANSLDVVCIEGNGVSSDVQREAGVPTADLLIAVASSDEVNIFCCLIARKLGARHTIARVRNLEYVKELPFLKEELGLSMAVNPEKMAADEIVRTLRFPSAMKVDFFCRGRVEMAEFKITKESPLPGMALHTLTSKFKVRVLVCAVERGEEVFIPDGDFHFEEGDRVTITASPKDMQYFFRGAGMIHQRVRDVMIAGGGKISYYLSRQLIDMGIRVKIIEKDPARCEQLSEWLPQARVLCGDCSNQDMLMEEGIDHMDAFVALTGIDEENVVVSMYAISENVGKVFTKVNHITFGKILEKAGIECVITPHAITCSQIVRYVRARQNSLGSKVEAMVRIAGNKAETLEFKVRESFQGCNTAIKNLHLKRGFLIACIIRGGRVLFPTGEDRIEVGDSVIIVTTQDGLQDLNAILV